MKWLDSKSFSLLRVMMKKYLLVLSLVVVVFLWMGNYTIGQQSAYSQAPDWTTNDWTTTDSSNNVVYGNWKTITTDSSTSSTSSSTTTTNATSPVVVDTSLPKCDPSNSKYDHGHLNSITNLCECDDWYKDVWWKCHACSEKWVCCWISLNTSVPFIGNCIEDNNNNVWVGEAKWVNSSTAFPVLMGSLTKILVTLILIISFVMIIVWGIMIATGNPSGGKKMIINVVIGIAVLGASGVILRLINPNFFG